MRTKKEQAAYYRRWYENNQKIQMTKEAVKRAVKRGIEATITEKDIVWPTYCPVLGMKLNYGGGQGIKLGNSPSLDRWDNSKGYVPGNVYVISRRANVLKADANVEEMEKVLNYMRGGVTQEEEEVDWVAI